MAHLNSHCIRAISSNGNMTALQRASALRSFRFSEKIDIMVVSDSFTRGVHLEASLVINFNLPPQHTFYYFRSTRVGQFGMNSL